MKQACAVLLILFSFFTGVVAGVAESALPRDLTVIEEEAFRGDKMLSEIAVPDGVTAICGGAFADTALKRITIPASVTDIASDAFEDVASPMLIVTVPDSTAAAYAMQNNLDFRADTVCRALLIGQMDYPGSKKLTGPGKDIAKLGDILTDYSVSTQTDLTAGEIIDAVAEAFAGAKAEDISLFYYSGHGNATDGALVGIDMEGAVTAAELRSALDGVAGRKIVLIDACYSGALIEVSMNSSPAVDPAAAFIRAFVGGQRRSASTLAAQSYYILASSANDEESWETNDGGIFTGAFIESRERGDADADGVVTLEEAFQCIREEVQQIVGMSGITQSVQVYPEECRWFGLFR